MYISEKQEKLISSENILKKELTLGVEKLL